MFQDPKKPIKSKGITKLKSSNTCFECNRKGHNKLECQEFHKQEEKSKKKKENT